MNRREQYIIALIVLGILTFLWTIFNNNWYSKLTEGLLGYNSSPPPSNSPTRAPSQRPTKAPTCYRYATIAVVHRGLGHRLSDIALGLEFASRIKAELAIKADWNMKYGEHGNYGWFPSFSGLKLPDINEVSRLHLREIKVPEWNLMNTEDYRDHCNVLFSTTDRSCRDPITNKMPVFCQSLEIPAFEKLFYHMYPQFAKTKVGSAHRQKSLVKTQNRCVNFLAHVRNGDFQIGCGGNFERNVNHMISDTMLHIDAKCFTITIFSSRLLSPSCRNDIYNYTYHNNSPIHWIDERLDPENVALDAFLSSDILVGSGSSFPVVAAALSPWVIHIAPPPKEIDPNTTNFGVYKLPNDILYNNENRTLSIQVESGKEIRSVGDEICNRLELRRKRPLCKGSQYSSHFSYSVAKLPTSSVTMDQSAILKELFLKKLANAQKSSTTSLQPLYSNISTMVNST